MSEDRSAKPVWSAGELLRPHEVVDKSGRVKRMFNAIAPRYELVNHLFSAGRDAYWRRRAVQLSEVHAEHDVLDVACGTGDFARTFASAGARSVTGCDFAHEMLRRASNRPEGKPASAANAGRTHWVEADALRLPFADQGFDRVSCAFGVRNLQDPAQGLREMYRVLRPGGRLVVLEFSRPRNRVGAWAYGLYSQRIMPATASWISGDRTGAYRYLPRSVAQFPDGEAFRRLMLEAGFAKAEAHRLTFGVVTVYLGHRARKERDRLA